MNKNSSLIITLALVFTLGIVFWGGSNSNLNSASKSDPSFAPGNNVEIRDGIQYVKIDAKGGYNPNVSVAKAGIPTKLIMNTKGTFDCSSSLVIKSLNYQQVLPPDGETEIDIGTPKVGEPLQGMCGMGMYNFQVRFN